MSAHDQIVAALLEVLQPLGGELRLIGRVNDPIIGNTSDKEVFFFVPDIHTITPDRQARFGAYEFNHTETKLLAALLGRLAKLRMDWALDGANKLVTVQLGDFIDMWRQFPGSAQPGSIPNDFRGELRDLLYRGVDRGRPCLKATMLLGNHDTRRGTPLPEVQFRFRAFNRTTDDAPFLFVTHGDAFDRLEQFLPDPFQEFVVNLIGRLTPFNTRSIGSWGECQGRVNKPFSQLQQAIVSPNHDLSCGAAGAPAVTPGAALPNILGQTGFDQPDDADHPYFADYYQALERAAVANLPGQSVRTVVQGHTHTARVMLHRPAGGRALALMDVGAWIEDCTYPRDDGAQVREPSAQLGVIHGNDVRLYQVSLDQSRTIQ